MSKKFLVSWIGSEDLGIYDGETADDAILAAVKDAGYRDFQDAAEFIYDEKGELTLQAVDA